MNVLELRRICRAKTLLKKHVYNKNFKLILGAFKSVVPRSVNPLWASVLSSPLSLFMHLTNSLCPRFGSYSESNRDHSKMKKEIVKKSLEKSRNVLAEKRKSVKQKNLHKDKHVYNNCYGLHSRANKKVRDIISNMRLPFN